MSSNDSIRWTPPSIEAGDTKKRPLNILAYAKRIRAAFLKGAALSRDELTTSLCGHVEIHLYRRISDRLRMLKLLERVSELTVSELMWLSDQPFISPQEKIEVNNAITRLSIVHRARKSQPLSSDSSAQNDKSAEFPPNIVRD